MQFREIENIIVKSKFAYFTMEIGLENSMNTYAGGLGVLAGDIIKSAADLKLPLIAVTLIHKNGYFKQRIDREGNQFELLQEWNPKDKLRLLPNQVCLTIDKRDVYIKAWLLTVGDSNDYQVPVIFLDTDHLDNHDEDREITNNLYGKDSTYRIKQEMVLGIGGVKMLNDLSVNIEKYHMNEGHSSFLSLELLKNNNYDIDKVKDLCIFTTHTPIEAGHDKFDYAIISRLFGDYISLDILKKLGGNEYLNMTHLALNMSNYVNGVAKIHKEITKKMFPEHEIHSITNGVHSNSWVSQNFKKIYDKYIPGWSREPSLLYKVDLIPEDEIWQAHQECKVELFNYINQQHDLDMDPDIFTIGFARRATAYKRANLIFTDLERLKAINKVHKIQVIFSGKAHKMDNFGKDNIKEIINKINMLSHNMKITYLEDYDLDLAKKIISGVDLWLNTPQRPLEASGTSGMKASHNGVLNFSVLDGWWIEGCIEGVTGWSIGYGPEVISSPEETLIKEIEDLYAKLEYIILPLYYQHRSDWIKLMKNSIGKITPYFNSHRMLKSYLVEGYLNNQKDRYR